MIQFAAQIPNTQKQKGENQIIFLICQYSQSLSILPRYTKLTLAVNEVRFLLYFL